MILLKRHDEGYKIKFIFADVEFLREKIICCIESEKLEYYFNEQVLSFKGVAYFMLRFMENVLIYIKLLWIFPYETWYEDHFFIDAHHSENVLSKFKSQL